VGLVESIGIRQNASRILLWDGAGKIKTLYKLERLKVFFRLQGFFQMQHFFLMPQYRLSDRKDEQA